MCLEGPQIQDVDILGRVGPLRGRGYWPGDRSERGDSIVGQTRPEVLAPGTAIEVPGIFKVKHSPDPNSTQSVSTTLNPALVEMPRRLVFGAITSPWAQGRSRSRWWASRNPGG